MPFKSLSLVFAAAIASASAQQPSSPDTTVAAPTPTFKFGKPTILGVGCVGDSAAVIPSTDGQSASVRFSAMNAVTSTDTQRDRKSCALAVPVNVQAGFALGITRVEYNGNVRVSKRSGSSAQFDAEYFFAGQRGPIVTNKYASGTTSDFSVTNESPATATVWSSCGASTIFRVNSAITVLTPPLGASDAGQTSVDSVNSSVQTTVRYYATTKVCKN